IYPHFARAALEFLGSLQATDDDPYRDAEPGKILHELRCGELAHFKLVPHTPYYGTADATPLYLITLHAAWRATGDKALLERHIDTAENCLALLWQIFSGTGFPNQFFNDSWVVGFWRADHGRHNVELGRLRGWLKPFLDRLGHKSRRRMCPLYVAGLFGPGDRKSVQPMAERLAPVGSEQ